MYVWAFRDKGSEWMAVNSFRDAGKLPFIPLIEATCEPYLPRRDAGPRSIVEGMRELGAKASTLTDSGRVWLDLSNLRMISSEPDLALLHEEPQRSFGLMARLITPVIRTNAGEGVIRAVIEWDRRWGCGVCIRIDGPTQLREKADLVRVIARETGLMPSAIDLVFDAQDLPRAISHAELADWFPLSQSARSWVVAGGAFPPSISDMSPDEYEHKRDRAEWDAWQTELETPSSPRHPMFCDFATQPAVYRLSPSFPGSPSVRYTASDSYVVLRGRGGYGSVGADYTQFVGHAIYLLRQPYFRGVARTAGDAYAERIATRAAGTGNLTTWRVASFQRHIQVVTAQVARYAEALFEPLSASRR
jgi:hypothetical protein